MALSEVPHFAICGTEKLLCLQQANVEEDCLGAGCPKQVTAKGHLVGGKSKRTVEGGRGRGPSLRDQ